MGKIVEDEMKKTGEVTANGATGLDTNYEFTEKDKVEMKEFIERDIADIKTDTFKSILREKNIDFDDSITKYDDLKKSVRNSVDSKVFSEICAEEEENQKEITEFLSVLENDGDLTPKKLLNDFNNMVVKPTAKSVATIGLSRVLFDAMVFLPSPVRTIAGVAALGTTIFKGVKGQLDKFRAQETERYDNVLEKLRTHKDEEGNVVSKEYSSAQTAEILKFLSEKGVKTEDESYNSMNAEVAQLKNKDKLALIKRINEVSGDKLDIDDELRKERKMQKAKAGKKNILKVIAGAALGIVGANLDKEVVDLVNPLVSRESAEMTYQMRTGFSKEHNPLQNLIPYGLLGTSAVSLISNLVGFIGKSLKDRKASKEFVEKEGDAKLTDNQKLVLGILKTKLLENHPEDEEKIGGINTLNEFKAYTKDIPKAEKQSMTDLIVKLNNIVKSKDAKTQAVELAKILGNSALLAGNSILAYQILLFLKNKLILGAPGVGQGTPGQEELQPEKQPAYATAKEPAYATNPAKEPATSTVPAMEPVPVQNPVTNPAPAPNPGTITNPIPDSFGKSFGTQKPAVSTPSTSQALEQALEAKKHAIEESMKSVTQNVKAPTPSQSIHGQKVGNGRSFEVEEAAPSVSSNPSSGFSVKDITPDFNSGAWPATRWVIPFMLFETLWMKTRKIRELGK